MRYAIISDIHSNLEALTAVLSHIKNNKVDKILCLGDIVGYGPNPNECAALVKSTSALSILGNHDFACIEQSEIEYFNQFARQAVYWTIENLSEISYSFISQLPLCENIDNFYLVHASPDQPSHWNYILSIDQAIYNFSYFDAQICLIGHSHIPVIFVETTQKNYLIKRESYLKINKGERYLINIGSVGQPRDYNPNAAYALLDTTTKEFHLYRVPYDFKKTQQKMRKKGLPDFLIERLGTGR